MLVELPIRQCVLLGIAVMNFVNGSVDDAVMHDLRHLRIWQASLGISVIVLSLWFRLSLFIVSTTTSFLVLTTTAAIFDLVKGHSGPWADATHVIEAFVLVLLLILTWPRARLTLGERWQLPPIHRDS